VGAMMGPMVLEVRDSRGRIVSRVRLGDEPLTVGRALDNRVVLDDAHVDAHHLTISISDEGVVVEDLGSTNGSVVGGVRIAGNSSIATDGTAVVVGRTRLLLRSVTAPVPPARALGGRITRALTSSPRLPWGLAAGSLVLIGVQYHLGTYQKVDGVELMFTWVGIAIVLALWAGMWALGGRLFANRSNFRAHMGFSALAVLVGIPAFGLVAYVLYLFPGNAVNVWVDWIFTIVVFWPLLLFGHIDIASQRATRTKLIITGGIVVALGALGIAINSVDDSHNSEVSEALVAVRPLPTWLQRSTSVDRFTSQLSDLEAELERDVLDVEIDDE